MHVTPVRFSRHEFRDFQYDDHGLAVTPQDLENALSRHFGRMVVIDDKPATFGFLLSETRGRIPNFHMTNYPISPRDLRAIERAIQKHGKITRENISAVFVILGDAGVISRGLYIVLTAADIERYRA